ncbi:hypothetical protein B0H14DRAFT_3145277 [Mycena olivaceomarginata]|nr:hypothetical protein B0H14DRAFT_3145277 [Mycena olivaceomarginata]
MSMKSELGPNSELKPARSSGPSRPAVPAYYNYLISPMTNQLITSHLHFGAPRPVKGEASFPTNLPQAIMEMKSGTNVPSPLDWSLTTETNTQRNETLRTQYLTGITEIIVLAFFRLALQDLDAHKHRSGFPHQPNIWLVPRQLVHVLCGSIRQKSSACRRASTFFSILTAVLAMVLRIKGTAQSAVFTIIFPPSFYIFAIRTIDGFEHRSLVTNISHHDPNNHLVLTPLIIIGIIDVFLWPCLALTLERMLYEARHPGRPWWRISSRRAADGEEGTLDPALAVSVRGLGKTFKSLFCSEVTAILDLTLDIPRSGIFVLWGSNGAGKSTFLNILGGLIGASRGIVTFPGGTSTPPRGTLHIVPQKNVLIKESSPLQTLRLFRAVKWSPNSAPEEDLEQLLRECNLGNKIHSSASTLSGGQKRKLQLAIGLVGGSKLLLIDEARCFNWFSSLALNLPFSALLVWTLVRVARYGELTLTTTGSLDGFLLQLHGLAPDVRLSLDTPQRLLLHLGSKDTDVVARVLEILDAQSANYGIVSYDVLGTMIDDIFLDVMAKNQNPPIDEDDSPTHLTLANGRLISRLRQALIIFHKRALIARRSWFHGSPENREQPGAFVYIDDRRFWTRLTIPIYESPPGIISTLGSSRTSVNTSGFTDPNGFTQYINDYWRDLFDLSAGSSMFTWEGSNSPLSGVVMLNLVTNILLNRASNASYHDGNSPTLIQPIFRNFRFVDKKTCSALEWLVPFCGAMAVFPSFFALYVAKERESSVKTMQLPDGISNPVGLWLGHLLFDSIPTLFTILPNQFYGLGLLIRPSSMESRGLCWRIACPSWYCHLSPRLLQQRHTNSSCSWYSLLVSLVFQAHGQLQLYLAGYLLAYTYANPENTNSIIKAIHFSLSLLSPIASVGSPMRYEL